MCVSPRLRFPQSLHTLTLSVFTDISALNNPYSLLFSFSSLRFRCLLLVVLLFLGLDQVPLFLALDSDREGSVVIASAVVANASVPPELVDQEGDTNDVRVVKLVVVADPGAD
jgi:hypothetical protein